MLESLARQTPRPNSTSARSTSVNDSSSTSERTYVKMSSARRASPRRKCAQASPESARARRCPIPVASTAGRTFSSSAIASS